MKLLDQFYSKGFISILVHFDVPDHILKARIANSNRSTAVFRTASTFDEVLIRQQDESYKENVIDPVAGEADHLFVIKKEDDVESVMQEIINIAHCVQK